MPATPAQPLLLQLGQAMRAVRRQLGRSQTFLAGRMGCTRQHLSAFENGRDLPIPDTWHRWIDTVHAANPAGSGRDRRLHDLLQRARQLYELAQAHVATQFSGAGPAVMQPQPSPLSVPDARLGKPHTDRGRNDDVRRVALLEIAAMEVLPARWPNEDDGSHCTTARLGELYESSLEIAMRHRAMEAVNVDDAVIAALTGEIEAIVGRYEQDGPHRLLLPTVRIRRHADQLLAGRQHPRQRLDLYQLAGRLSGLLGYMSVNLDRPDLAAAYCKEALALADHAGDDDLVAWVRGTQSLAAYYARRYTDARDLAEAGLRTARNGPQAIRLLVNGHARALGRLGDRRGVDDSVGRAFELLGSKDLPSGLTPCISFAPYSQARVAANAATAYLSLDQVERVLGFAEQLDSLVAASDSTWSRSLVALDKATALLHTANPEVEQAMKLGREALATSAANPITSVGQRATELHQAAQQWAGHSAVMAFEETLRDWPKPTAPSLPPPSSESPV